LLILYAFHPEARHELFASIRYYEQFQRGLGMEFAREVHAAIQRILHFPEAWSKLSKNTRRCLTNRFPYGLIYQVAGGQMVVIAVMQMNRKPGYWRHRIK
jgi:hypothetical protein